MAAHTLVEGVCLRAMDCRAPCPADPVATRAGSVIDLQEGTHNRPRKTLADPRQISLPRMVNVLLVNQDKVPHYRVPIYSYLSRYLLDFGFKLTVIAAGIQDENPHLVNFRFLQMALNLRTITRVIVQERIDIVISWVELKYLYLFPLYFVVKLILRKKMIPWGQGRDLQDTRAILKNIAYAFEQSICDAILLYADHLKRYVPARFHRKIFVANNTLCFEDPEPRILERKKVLAEYGITTEKNIIYVGRVQRRRRLEDLFHAFRAMHRSDIGLILAGPDPDHLLDAFDGRGIYRLGPVYGLRKMDLLSAADVYCLPGAVGLSIIDAFHCGLPLVTEDSDESAEMMYLREGVNGFIVPKGDIAALGEKLLLLLRQ